MIRIGIRCTAGPDAEGKERKVTIVINVDGGLEEVRIGWPGPKDTELCESIILRITPEEWLLQQQAACGEI
jgi:hypothetical protein